MKTFLFPLILLALILPINVFAQESPNIRAEVTKILVDETQDDERRLQFEAIGRDGQTYRVDSSEGYLGGPRHRVREGMNVLLQEVENPDGTKTVFLVDVSRSSALVWIFILFAIIAIAIGRLHGSLALVGLLFTLLILFAYIFPTILRGGDPVLHTVIGSILILAVNMHISHGFSKRIFTAFLSTVVGLVLVLIFAKLFVFFANLSGLASEETILLYFEAPDLAIPSGLLLAGIILGAVGVLDDIAINQTETVAELKATDPKLNAQELYKKSMRIGRHHIASVINTLVLAYAGVAMPLFLLFMTTELDFWRFLNEEVVAEEIIRTLAGTMGLVLLVPIATWFAVLSQTKKSRLK